jgi:hypothetical protein
VVGVGAEEDLVAIAKVDLAADADGHGLLDPLAGDVEERVRAEMLRHAHLARPVAGFGGHAHMLGADADGRRPVIRRDLPADQVHFRRADEACDEEVPRRAVKLQR